MSAPWPKVTLGEVLRRSQETVEIGLESEYREVTVKLWGKGVVQRGIVSGSEISGNRRFVARADQFILSRIDARNGATGVVPPGLDGAVVTNDFPVFDVDTTRMQPAFLAWLSKTPDFVDLCKRASEGTTNRVRLQETRFLALEIPLPPLAEQRRIVARIDELAAKLAEARSLRRQAAKEAGALGEAYGNSYFVAAKEHFGWRRLEELTARITKGESPEWQGFAYQETGPLFIRSENVLWGKLDPANAVRISDAFHQKLSRSQLRPRDVLINLVGASIGRCCFVPDDLGKANVNQAVAVMSPTTELLLPDFLVHFLLSRFAQDQIHGGKVETARPNISLGDMRDLQIPLPPLPEQRRIVGHLDAMQAQVNAVKMLQTETAAEFDALLPAMLDRAFRSQL